MTEAVLNIGNLERLAGDAKWSEGPVWLSESRSVRWSDIPNNRILEWSSITGETRVFRHDAEFTNGRTLDLQGQVVQCSHGRRAIERESPDGPQTVVDRWAGGRFNSPNDLVAASDGSIWFTDPPYGLHPSGREGRPGEQEYDGCFVFRWDPSTDEATPVVTDMVHPNGLAFSPDESVLYVSDTGFYGDHPEAKHILRFELDGARLRGPGEVFAVVPVGAADGFVVDEAGRVWTSAGDGVYVYSPSGELLAHIPVPETVSNVCFGEGDLFITAATGLYRVRNALALLDGS